MLFSSLEFLYLFLPLTVFVYFISPSAAKNHILLSASLCFYGLAEPRYLPLMLLVCVMNYSSAILIEHASEKNEPKRASAVLALTLCANIGILFLFKYLAPILSLFGISSPSISLPVGISFYTFQAMSYVIDVKRKTVKPQRSLLSFLTYVSLFPQLIAGPIVRYSDVDAALSERPHSLRKAAEGLILFSVGLSKKVLLANPAGECFERLVQYSKNGIGTTLGAWLGLVFFAFQIYFDFSGYSDMARGLGKIFGFDFPQNFRYPYVSRSITEFWRRWHITLSSFFREYVYIPLGGSRRGRARTYLNLLVVWSLTGLWHGGSVRFLLWGLYFFVVILLEKAVIGSLLQKLPPFFQHFYALVLILVGWLIFASDGLLSSAQTAAYFKELFFLEGRLYGNESLFELCSALPFIAIMAIGATPIPRRSLSLLAKGSPLLYRITLRALSVLALLACTAYITASGYNPFLYFRF